MLNIRNKVVSQLNTTNAQMSRFVKLKNQLDTKMASYLRYLGTKNAVNRASDYHYLMLAVYDSTAPVNGIDYIHPVVKPAVDYVTVKSTLSLCPTPTKMIQPHDRPPTWLVVLSIKKTTHILSYNAGLWTPICTRTAC